MQPTSIRLEKDVARDLKAEADARDLSRNRYIQQIIDDRHALDDVRTKYNQLQDRFHQLQRDYADLEARDERDGLGP